MGSPPKHKIRTALKLAELPLELPSLLLPPASLLLQGLQVSAVKESLLLVVHLARRSIIHLPTDCQVDPALFYSPLLDFIFLSLLCSDCLRTTSAFSAPGYRLTPRRLRTPQRHSRPFPLASFSTCVTKTAAQGDHSAPCGCNRSLAPLAPTNLRTVVEGVV